MPVKATRINDKIRDAFFFPYFAIGESGTTAKKEFAKKFKISDRSAWEYYHFSKKAFEAITDGYNELIKSLGSEILDSIKEALEKPYETAAKLQEEIEDIQRIIEQGYILKRISVDGDTREIYEPLKSAQLIQWHKLMDEKRDRIAKITGVYVERVEEVEIETAHGLTFEELEEKRKKLLDLLG